MVDSHYRSCGVSSRAVRGASRRQGPSFLFLLSLLLSAFATADPPESPTVRVGIPLTLTDIYIPGGEARPKPRPNREPPLVVRLLEVKPAQDGKRYDLEVYGLEAGHYDLATFLEAVDPANPPQFATIALTITTELPPGLPPPAELSANTPKKLGGYKLALWALGILWVLVLVVLIFWRRAKAAETAAPEVPATLAERLRSLLREASQGNLDDDQKASLERLILGHWRQRLPELASHPPAEALATLRHHQEAGPLLLQLEQWIHKPGVEISSDRIDELLAPYRG